MSVVVNIIRNPFEPELREQYLVEHAPGKMLDYYMPDVSLEKGKSLSMAINGYEVKDDPAAVPVYDGDKIAVAIRTDGAVAGAVASWVVAATTSVVATSGFSALVGAGMYGAAAIYGATYLATFAAIGFGVSTLVSAISPDTPSFRAGETLESPTYGWDILQQTETEGNPIPILFGKQKIAGQILNQFKTIGEDGKEYLHMLLGICDHAVDGIEDIRVNDQPAEYYKDVTTYTRLGTLDDSVIPGFAQQVQQNNVGVQFVQQNDVHTQQTDGNSVEELRIILAANRGMYYSNDRGGLDERYADFEIKYRAVGDTSWTTHKSRYRISGATTEAIRREIRIAGLPPDQYEVRITRLSEETPSHREETRVVWQQLLEIVDEALIYPGLAKYAITALATDQLSGAAPTVSCIAERNTVSIYNPNTSLWESRPADNPAWACYALLNTHHGIHHSRMLYDEFDEWAAWCAEMVDGEPRCKVNIYFDTQGNAWNQAQSIARLGRGTIVRRGTKYGVFVDKPEDVVSHLFTPGNIIEGTFNLEYLPQKDRANAVEIAYNDPDRDYTNQVVAVYSDDFKNEGTPENKTNIKYNAAIPRAQAIREAAFLLNSNKWLVRTIEFEAAVDSFACTVGDLVYFQHVIPDYENGLGGRIVAAGNDDGSGSPYVQLDQEVELIAGQSYAVLVRLGNDDLVEKQLQAVTTTYSTDLLLLTSNWGTVPSEYDVYAFGPANTYKKQYRITNITRAQDLTRRITCLEYVPEIYEDTSYIIETPTWGPAVSQEAANVTAHEFLSFGKGGDYQSNIAVTWQPANTNVGSNWAVWLEDQTLTRQWISDEGGEFEADTFETTEESIGITKVGETSENRIRIGPSYLTQFHEYKIFVGPVDGGMQDTGENTTTIQILGKLAPPNDVAAFAGSWNAMKRTVNFSWQEVDNIDVSHYEIRQGTVWDIGTVVVKEAQKGSASIAIEEGVSETRTYLIKAVDTSGIYSINYASTDVAINTAESPLQVPTGLSLSTNSGIASDGTDRVTILAGWDNNAEVADEFRHYELMLEVISTGKKSAYVTTETEYQIEVLPNTEYGVSIRAVDMTGNKTAWATQVTIIAAKDSVAPAVPAWATTALVPGFKVIGLRWQKNTEYDLSHYEVERSTNGTFAGEEVSLGNKDGNFTTDSDLAVDTTYYYRVRAVDTSGNASGWSSVKSATTSKVGTEDIAYNSIIAEHIDVTELSAIVANIGHITAGVIESNAWGADDGMQVDLDNELVRLGGSSSPKLSWDDTGLAVEGSITVTGGTGALNFDDGPAEAGADVTSNHQGDISLGNLGERNWSSLNARPEIYRIVSRGGYSTTHPITSQLLDESGSVLKSGGRSYNVSIYNRSTNTWDSHTTYDVFGDAANAGTMAAALNALGSDKIVVIFTYDEPQSNRTTNGLPDAIYRCGGSRGIFASGNFMYRSAYILIGIPGIGEGNGIELYAGDTDEDTDAWVDTSIQIFNGNLQLGRINVRDAVDISYADGTVVEDLKPAEVNADVTANNTAADTYAINGIPSPNISGWAHASDSTKIDGGNILVTRDATDYTLISGGYVDTNLLTANNIQTGTLKANLVRIESGDGNTYFDGNTMYVYDSDGNLRVKLGEL